MASEQGCLLALFNGETIDLFEDDLGYPQGSIGSTWEYERVATLENDSTMFKGGIEDMPDIKPIQNIENQPLRRFERSYVFLNKCNEYVVDSRVKFGTKRSDIAYFVHCLSQFMHKPLKYHLKIAFKVLRYFKGSPCKGIHITKSANTSLEVYVDLDWAKKKQNTLSKSSVEAGYRAIASATSETVWIIKILKDLN
ncbi:ribonuclease H-like domain-containing protein [Tanacetum coccineum]